MKANLVVLTMLALTTTVSAKELFYTDSYKHNAPVAVTAATAEPKFTGEVVADNEKDMKIATLNKLLDQQQRLYEEKVSYLEFELKKSKERLVEKSINHDRMQAALDKRYMEESNFLKRELITKTKTLMEYQRQLEKVKPSEDMKNLIKVNTELALEVRRNSDQMALAQLRGVKEEKTSEAKRMPASVEEK